MSKHRLTTFALNIIAAISAAASAWLPWFGGNNPKSINLTVLFGVENFIPNSQIIFSVAMVIFVAAGLMFAAAILQWKIFAILGVLIGGATVVLWFMSSDLTFPNFNLDQVGLGATAMTAAVVLSFITIFIRRYRRRMNDNSDRTSAL